MNNFLIAVIAVMVMALSTPALGASERWTCEIDLHRGEIGRLEFDRTESGIRGNMTVEQQFAGGPRAAAIQGLWGREVMRFTRTLASGEETFMGIALGTDPGVVKVAGRFGAAFSGIWSATCSNAATDPSAGGSGPGVTPIPTPSPVPPTRAACNIVIAASGSRADVAKIFQIIVRGPDSMTAIRARQPFEAGEVSFPNLPGGRYIVTVDTKADIAVNVTPRRHEVVCSGGTVARKVFEFR